MQNDTALFEPFGDRSLGVAGIDPEYCPVERTLKVIAGRWKPLILFHLRPGSRRFNELRRLIPSVTQRMLTQHLRELEADGVVSRTVTPSIPPRVDYAFTAQGRTLLPILDAMAIWGEERGSTPDSPEASAFRST